MHTFDQMRDLPNAPYRPIENSPIVDVYGQDPLIGHLGLGVWVSASFEW